MSSIILNSVSSPFKNLKDGEALEFWKHFSGIGGQDKDRMVTITTWLLAFSATIIGYTLTHNDSCSNCLLAIIGIFISIFACWIVLLYGSYSMWNWAMADNLADFKEWDFLKPNREFPNDNSEKLEGFDLFEFNLIKRFGKPPYPRTKYAVIFKRFFLVAVISALINALIFDYFFLKIIIG